MIVIEFVMHQILAMKIGRDLCPTAFRIRSIPQYCEVRGDGSFDLKG